MTPAENKAWLEKLLTKVDGVMATFDRLREHILDELGRADRAELAEHEDLITELMLREGLGFIEAVELLAHRTNDQ